MSLPTTLERVLELSRADACIVMGWHHSNVNLRWALNSSTTNGAAEAEELLIVSVIDGRVSSIARSYFPDESLEALVRESEAACAGKPPAEDLIDLLKGDGAPADWEDPVEKVGVGVFGRLSEDLASALQLASVTDHLLFGYAEYELTTTFLATSSGLRRRYTGAEGTFQLNAKTPDFEVSAWAGQVTTTFSDIDVAGLHQRLQQRLEWSKNRIELPAGHYEVLLEPSAVADLLIEAYWSAAARDADEGRSAFSKPGGGNRIGERLAPEGVTLYSDPAEPALEVAPFVVAPVSSSHTSVFDNGMATGRTEWLAGGVLNRLITTRHHAEQSSTEPAPFVDNLVFPAEGPALEEMIAGTKRGLLVTCLWYIREVDPQKLLLTGLTRDGVFLIEDGEVRGAVNNFRFNMSPLDVLSGIEEIGGSVRCLARELGDYFRFAKMPPLRVSRFHMSSVSESV